MKSKICYLWLFVFLTVCSLCSTTHGQTGNVSKKQNILFFLVDDLGAKDLGYSGSVFHETPHIDALARDSKVFSNAYAAAPVCSPTRAAIMTGKYPVKTGITNFIGAPQQQAWKRNTQLLSADYIPRLALEEYTLAEALQAGGYTTYFVGKWHLGGEGYYPEDQGFHHNKGGFEKGHPGKGYFSPYNNPRLTDGPVGEYLPERLAQETSQFIKAQKYADNPFFIFHSFYLVHTPLLPHPELEQKYQNKRDGLGLVDEFHSIGKDVYDASKIRKVRLNHSLPSYAAMVEALDQAVGKIVGTLKEEGLYDNTIIVFTSDNGGLSTSEGSPTSNEPLRAGKGWPYQGGLRVPLIARFPEYPGYGDSSDQVVVSTDFYPTLLQAVGLRPSPDQQIDGVDILLAIKGEELPLRPVFWHYPHYGNQGGSPFSAVLYGHLKLIRFYENGGYEELYDLQNDPSERLNIVGNDVEQTLYLRKILNNFLTENKAIYPEKNPSYKPKN